MTTIEKKLRSSSGELLSPAQISDLISYSRMMLNLFRLPKEVKDARESLEQALRESKFIFAEGKIMVMGAALCLLSRGSDGSQFYLTEKYELTPYHEQGFKDVIDGDVTRKDDVEYASGIVVDVHLLGRFVNLKLVDFDKPLTLSDRERKMIKDRVKSELGGEVVIIGQK